MPSLPAVESTAQALYEQAVAAQREARRADAERLAVAALAADPDRQLATRIQHLRGRILTWGEKTMRAYELLVTEAMGCESTDPRQATLMWLDASSAALAGREIEAALHAALRSVQLGTGAAPDLLPVLETQLGLAEILAESPVAGRARMLAAVRKLEVADFESWDRVHDTAAALFWLEEYGAARLLLEQLVEQARATGFRTVLPGALDTMAAIDYRMGRWRAADGRSAEALRLARELDQTFQISSCLSTLASIAAARGEEQACRAYVSEVLKTDEDLFFVGAWARVALGSLALSQGRTDEAIAVLEQVASSNPYPDPAIVPWPRELVEAYVRSGRLEQARGIAEETSARLAETNRPGLRAVDAHCRGLVAETASFSDHFEESLRWHDRTRTPFLRARTELAYGERLRRSRRNAAAKTHLQRALAVFEQLGARLWAERARAELATGRRATGRSNALRDLTPHEVEVALVVGRGATNKEAAAALYVSPKTIDYHLASIYRKLGVRSRTELAALLAGGSRSVRG